MDLLHNLALGAGAAFTATNLLYCFIGAVSGTLVGVLPGLGPMATISMLLPLTFGLDPLTALLMLAGIYYGAQYGGSITAILINLPGESSAVMTALDGHKMARRGDAGKALSISAIGSFVAGTISTGLIAVAGPPLALMALRFGPADYFSLMVLGLVASIVLAHGSVIKAIGMTLLGLLIGLVGTDLGTGTRRFTFGEPELADGFSILAIAMGIFAIAEIIRNLEREHSEGEVKAAPINSLWLNKEDIRRSVPAIARGTILGSILGVLPGGGVTLASFAAYSLEKKVSKYRRELGQGAIEGVASPESANNAAAQTSFIPLLTLGIPANPIMALMVGAFIIHGIRPGPEILNNQPTLFWGLIVSMWIGNLILLVLNLPLVGIWATLLKVPYKYLFPTILVTSVIGVYSLENSVFDIFCMIGFGILGYVLLKQDCEPAPLLLGYILGPMMEQYLRRALTLSRGDPLTLIEEPISAVLLGIAAIGLISIMLPAIRKKREIVFVE